MAVEAAHTQLGLFDGCQRWHKKRVRHRPAGEPFDPSRHGVEAIDFTAAKSYVEEHHYAGSMPAARLQLGLFRRESAAQKSRLAGVIVFSVPMQERAIPAWLDGLSPRCGVEIGRLVLADEVEGNGESWFLGRAFRALTKALPEVSGVLSYCDPVERRTAEGQLAKRGHTGSIYVAHNGRYVGRSTARTLILSADGRCVNERSLSKIRLEEQGAGYAIRQLQDMGAPRRLPYESGPDYVRRALEEGTFHRIRHPGNLVFTWHLKRRRQAVY